MILAIVLESFSHWQSWAEANFLKSFYLHYLLTAGFSAGKLMIPFVLEFTVRSSPKLTLNPGKLWPSPLSQGVQAVNSRLTQKVWQELKEVLFHRGVGKMKEQGMWKHQMLACATWKTEGKVVVKSRTLAVEMGPLLLSPRLRGR